MNKLSKNEIGNYGKFEKDFKTKDCFKDMFDILREPKTIFDVGAWEGNTTEKLLSFFPTSEFFCFEPNPEGYERLKQKFNKNKNVHTFELAISDKEGYQDLFQYDQSPANSLMRIKKDAERYLDSETKFLLFSFEQSLFIN